MYPMVTDSPEFLEIRFNLDNVLKKTGKTGEIFYYKESSKVEEFMSISESIGHRNCVFL